MREQLRRISVSTVRRILKRIRRDEPRLPRPKPKPRNRLTRHWFGVGQVEVERPEVGATEHVIGRLGDVAVLIRLGRAVVGINQQADRNRSGVAQGIPSDTALRRPTGRDIGHKDGADVELTPVWNGSKAGRRQPAAICITIVM